MSFDFTTLITDRTQADVNRVKQIAEKIENGTASESELAEFNSAAIKGAYNYTDLNRVTAAMEALKAKLEGYGYAVPGYQVVPIDGKRTVWIEEDSPTPGQMQTYLGNVSAVRAVLDMLATTPDVPPDMVALTVQDANDIEQILFDVEKVIYQVVNGFSRNAAFTFWSGNRPLPSATSDMGRTWEQLDAMNTTWANWQVADWYLLLYGNLKAEGVVE